MKCLKYLLMFSLLFLVGCQSQTTPDSLPIVKSPLRRSESLLHTVVQISIYHENQEKVMDEAIAYIKEMEALLSTQLEGSDVYNINQGAGTEVKVDDRTFTIIEKAVEMSAITDGQFDISIGAVSTLWKIGDEAARKPSQEEIEAALPHIDYKKIELNKDSKTVKIAKGMALELGAISKGFIADELRTRFEQAGITTAIINLGGNVIAMGSSPSHDDGWHVGVQDPDEIRGQTVGQVPVSNQSVVTSGIYERYLEQDGQIYHHILNPQTGYPVDNTISGVTILTNQSIEADALSTTVFLLGLEKGLDLVNQRPDVEAVFITKDRNVYLSDGLQKDFKLTNEEYHLAN